MSRQVGVDTTTNTLLSHRPTHCCKTVWQHITCCLQQMLSYRAAHNKSKSLSQRPARCCHRPAHVVILTSMCCHTKQHIACHILPAHNLSNRKTRCSPHMSGSLSTTSAQNAHRDMGINEITITTMRRLGNRHAFPIHILRQDAMFKRKMLYLKAGQS